MQVIGVIVLVAGIALFIGNVSGAFPTFPGLGWITIAIGGVIMRSGGDK
jgi:hypothetical protein